MLLSSRLFLSCLFALCFFTSIQAQSGKIGFVEAEIDNATPYVGQPITYTFRFFYTFTPFQEAYRWPDFSGFGQSFQPEFLSVQVINGEQYTVYSQEIILYPLRAGEFTISETTITLPETPFQSGDFLATEPLVVNVQPLPPNLSSYFTGAVGQFDIAAELSQKVIRLGESSRLSVAITGTGNLQQFSAPIISIPTDWQAIRQTPTLAPSGSIPTFGTQIFIWDIFPTQEGRFLLEPIVFTYFDPSAGTYQTIQTSAMPIEVLPGLAVPQPTPISTPNTRLDLEPIPAVMLRSSSSLNLLDSIWLWLISPLCGLGMLVWMWKDKILERNQGPKRSLAFKKAQKQLRQAQSSSPESAYWQIDTALRAYFADRIGIENGSMLKQDDVLTACASLSNDLQRRIESCFEQLGVAQYSPYSIQKHLPLLKYVQETLKLVDEQWPNDA